VLGDTDALGTRSSRHENDHSRPKKTHFLDYIGAKLLNRKRAHVASELTNDTIAKTIVVKIQDILDNLNDTCQWNGLATEEYERS